MTILKEHVQNFQLTLRWQPPLRGKIDLAYGSDAQNGNTAALRISPEGVSMILRTGQEEHVIKQDPTRPQGCLVFLRRGSYARVLYDGRELCLQGGVGEWCGHYMAAFSTICIQDLENELTGCDYTPLSWLLPQDAPAIPSGPDGSYMEQQILPGGILAHGGAYYMYTMCGRKGTEEGASKREIGVCISHDLLHWQASPKALIRLGELNIPHDNYYPGACLKTAGGKFVLLLAVQTFPKWAGICAFLADDPLGPFVPYAENPVVKPSTPHHEFDVVECDLPQGRYMMYLSVYFTDAATGRQGDRGVRYFSDDLLHWRAAEDDSPFGPETTDGWDASHVRTRSVNYLDGKWYIWYEGVSHWVPPSFSEHELGFVNYEWWDTIGLARTSDFIHWEYYSKNPCLTQSGISAGRYDSTWVGWPRMVVKDGMCYIFHAASGKTVSVGCRTIPLQDLINWQMEDEKPESLLQQSYLRQSLSQ